MQVATFAIALLLATADPSLPVIDQAPYNDMELQRAARDYRIEAYNTHRLNRPAYDEHIDTGRRVLAAWNRQGGTEDQRQALLDWYASATQNISDGNTTLPPEPGFLSEPMEQLAQEENEEAQPTDTTPFASEDSVLADDTPWADQDANDLPPVVIEFPSSVTHSALGSSPPPAPPQPAATPVPSLDSTPGVDPLESADDVTGEPNDLSELPWGPEDDAFQPGSDGAISPRALEFNERVRELETELGGDEPWTAIKLEPLAFELDDLAQERRTILREAGDHGPSFSGQQLLSLEPALGLLGQRLEEARRNVGLRLVDPLPRKVEEQRIRDIELIQSQLSSEL